MRAILPSMKFVVESAVVFFGTLLAAALVAIGEPANAELAFVQGQTVPPSYEAVITHWLDDATGE